MATDLGELSVVLGARTAQYERALAEARKYTKLTGEDMKKLEAMDLKKAISSLNEVTRVAKTASNEAAKVAKKIAEEAALSTKIAADNAKRIIEDTKKASGIMSLTGPGKENIQKFASGMAALSVVTGAQLSPAVSALSGALNIADGAIRSAEANAGVAITTFRGLGVAIWGMLAPVLAVAAGIGGLLLLLDNLKKAQDALTLRENPAAEYSQSLRELAKVINSIGTGRAARFIPRVEVKAQYMADDAQELLKTAQEVMASPLVTGREQTKVFEAFAAVAKAQKEVDRSNAEMAGTEVKTSLDQVGDYFRKLLEEMQASLKLSAFKTQAPGYAEGETPMGPAIGIAAGDIRAMNEEAVDALKNNQKRIAEEKRLLEEHNRNVKERIASLKQQFDDEARARDNYLKKVYRNIDEFVAGRARQIDAQQQAQERVNLSGLPQNLADVLEAYAPPEQVVAAQQLASGISRQAPVASGAIDTFIAGMSSSGNWMGAMGGALTNLATQSQSFAALMGKINLIFVNFIDFMDPIMGAFVGLWNAILEAIASVLNKIGSIKGFGKLKKLAQDIREDYIINMDDLSEKTKATSNSFDDINNSIKDVTSSLNEPSGFKIAYQRFRATLPNDIFGPGGLEGYQANMAGFSDSWAGVNLSGVLGRSIVVQNVTVTNPANFDAMLDEVTRKADSVAAARGSIAPSGGASLSSQPVSSRTLIGKNLIGTFGMAYGGRP